MSELGAIRVRWSGKVYTYTEVVYHDGEGESLEYEERSTPIDGVEYVGEARLRRGDETLIELEEPTFQERQLLWMLAQAPEDIGKLFHEINTLLTNRQATEIYERQLVKLEGENDALKSIKDDLERDLDRLHHERDSWKRLAGEAATLVDAAQQQTDDIIKQRDHGMAQVETLIGLNQSSIANTEQLKSVTVAALASRDQWMQQAKQLIIDNEALKQQLEKREAERNAVLAAMRKYVLPQQVNAVEIYQEMQGIARQVLNNWQDLEALKTQNNEYGRQVERYTAVVEAAKQVLDVLKPTPYEKVTPGSRLERAMIALRAALENK